MHLKINLASPNDRLISIEPENLKSYIPWFIFKSSKCNFWFSHPKKLTHNKLQDKRMTKTIVTTENVNSK